MFAVTRSRRAEVKSHVHPRSRDDGGGALLQQVEGDGTAELAGARRWSGADALDERAAALVEHGSGQGHLAARDGRVAGNRRVAMAVQHPQYLALGVAA